MFGDREFIKSDDNTRVISSQRAPDETFEQSCIQLHHIFCYLETGPVLTRFIYNKQPDSSKAAQ